MTLIARLTRLAGIPDPVRFCTNFDLLLVYDSALASRMQQQIDSQDERRGLDCHCNKPSWMDWDARAFPLARTDCDMKDGSISPLSILVVDDSPDVAESLAELLTLCGHAIQVAKGGEEAFRVASAKMPDVILLDIRMPDVNGWEVAHRLRREVFRGKQAIIVAVTGYGQDSDRIQSNLAGIDLHLVKPVDPKVLINHLERFRQILVPTRRGRPQTPADPLEDS